MFLLHVTLIQTFHLRPRYEQNLLELITDFFGGVHVSGF